MFPLNLYPSSISYGFRLTYGCSKARLKSFSNIQYRAHITLIDAHLVSVILMTLFDDGICEEMCACD